MNASIFLHIPKTAGTTLRAIVERQYRPDELYTVYDGADDHHSKAEFEALTPEAQSSIKAYFGHVAFGVHAKLGGDLKYVTLLREPIERVISYYHHAMTIVPRFRAQPISLMKFIDERKDRHVDNLQTRLISGVDAPFKRCTNVMLQKAIDNIDEHFTFVGLSEQFDESLTLIAELFGWRQPYYVLENVGKGRPPLDYFSPRELEVVVGHNELDCQLYEHVQRRLEREICGAGAPFTRSVSEFRRKNELAQRQLVAQAVWP